MAAPKPIIYVSPEAKRILARKPSSTKPAQIHRYHVRVNTRDAAFAPKKSDDNLPDRGETKSNNAGVHHHHVTVNVHGESARKLGQYESTGSPDEGGVTQEGVKPGNAAQGIEETGTGRKGGADNPFDLILGYLHKLDARVSALEKEPRAAMEERQPDVSQPRGADAAKSPVSNMHTLTFASEHQGKEEQQQSAYADAPRSALAEKAHGLAPGLPLSKAEARSMTSPKRGPVAPLEDRYQRGESDHPRELIDKYPKGDPYRGNGVSSAPDAPAPQGGGGRESARLDRTTGATKYAWSQTQTGDSRPSPGDIIRALAEKERRMMRQICDEASIVVKARWQS